MRATPLETRFIQLKIPQQRFSFNLDTSSKGVGLLRTTTLGILVNNSPGRQIKVAGF